MESVYQIIFHAGKVLFDISVSIYYNIDDDHDMVEERIE